MQTDVSVKNPLRAGGDVHPAPAAGSVASNISVLLTRASDRAGLFSDVGSRSIVLDEAEQRGTRRSTPRLNVTARDLVLLDVHVGVKLDTEELVRRVARAQRVLPDTHVVRNTDLL